MEFKRFLHPNGRVSGEGQMLHGKPTGVWRNFNDDGSMRSVVQWEAGVLHGVSQFYDAGRPSYSITYANGKKNGDKVTLHKNGKQRLVEHFTEDVKDSLELSFDTAGILIKKIPFDKGLATGKGYEYAPEDGRIISVLTYSNGYLRATERMNRLDRTGQRTGMWKEFDDSLRVVLETPYRSNLRHGYQKRYDRAGSVIETKKFEEDVEVPQPAELAKLDIKRAYYPNAQLKQIGSYKNGKPEGVHRFYSEDGKLQSGKVYADGRVVAEGVTDEAGKRQGEWKEYYLSGELRCQGKYSNGNREGKWKFFYPDGKLEQEGEYRKGKYEGKWLWYHPDGSPWRDEDYASGKEEGPAIEWTPKGDTVAIGSFIEGEREGKWMIFYGDYREEGNYQDGKRVGTWKGINDEGKKIYEGAFVDDREDGRHLWYYPTGKIWIDGRYSFGDKDGNWMYYNEEGILKTTITYKAGLEVRIDGDRVGD